MDRSVLRGQIPHALDRTDIAGLGPVRRGKVRDIYELAAKDALLFVTTDRISAFDRILGTVPFKGELLTGLAAAWFERTKDVCRNHVLDRPDPASLVVKALRPVPVEVVVRGFLTGSLWRDYEAGKHGVYGIELAPGLARDSAFEAPLITPTTKEEVGTHDMPISEAEILSRGLVDARTWGEIVEKAKALFTAGQGWARSRGLELVDTKYEFGLDAEGGVWLMDEIHTPDSSRYWRRTDEGMRALDKEFLRQWLLARGWKGDGPPPEIPDDTWCDLAERYVELYELLEGREPELHPGPSAARVEANLRKAGLVAPVGAT
jgi:phosphoribosylaminoimidazole-succinocarboxamide synthase